MLAAIAACGDPDPTGGPDDDGRVTLGGSSLANRNFDGRVSYSARLKLDDAMVSPRLTGRFAEPDIATTFDPTTGVTRTLKSRIGFLTKASSNRPESIALDFARTHLDLLGLSDADLDGMEVTDLVHSGLTGTTHIYYRQRYLGMPVYNAQLQFNVHKDGRILSVNNSFVPNIASIAASTSPAVGAEKAIASAAANLSVELAQPPKVVSKWSAGVKQGALVDATGLSAAVVDTQLMWTPINATQVALAWHFQIETLDGNHYFDYTVDAGSGKVWTRFDWISADSYRAYKEPVESANHSTPAQPADGRVVVLNPADPAASPLGWQNDGNTTFRIHRGNNVHAYDDRDGNNAPPKSQPNCSRSRDCSFSISFANQPSQYTAAALTNVFYWTNLIHDVQYQYGFDEVSGNFQVNNFGKGGAGNDALNAEAQDGAGTDNANFATPPDGFRPRMQMFEWTQTSPRRDGDFDNGVIVHEYAHGISNRLVGGPSNTSCLANAQQGGEGWSDWYGLWYTARPSDVGPTGRGIGTYVMGQPTTGPGVRTQRYSTDPAINTHTYASIAGKVIPHGVGEVWAQALWEVYWALVETHGYDANIRNALGSGGNQRAMLYVTEGLKNTACSPTFVDARDGIIAAATAAHEGEDVCLLWGAFAAFGLGVDAISSGPDNITPTNGFRVPNECLCQPQPIADPGPDRAVCVGGSVTIGVPVQADTTYSWSPGGETTSQITVSPTTATVFTLTATNACGTVSDSVAVAVESSSGSDFSDEFETGAPGWSGTGLWHLADNSSCAPPGFSSPTHAFYYGRDIDCTYDVGDATTGSLTSPPVSGIVNGSILSFDYFRQVEFFEGAFDRTLVEVVHADGTATTVFSLDASTPSQLEWVSSGNISLAAFAGETIRLRFTFDSVDGLANRLRGWLIDNVTITANSACVALSPSALRVAPLP